MATYTFLAANVLTNVTIEELPLLKPVYSRVLNDAGTLDGIIDLDDANVKALGLIANGAVEPGAVALYALRDGAYVWGGILWSHSWDSQTGQLRIRAAEFDSYLAYRYVIADVTYTAVDRGTLVGNWITAAFADGGPPLTTSVGLVGVTDTLTFNHWEQHCVLDLMKAYCAMPTGQGIDVEFDIVANGSGNPSAMLTVSSPRRGRNYTNSNIILDYPGPVMSYTLSKDGTRMTQDLTVTGAGSGSTQLSAEAQTASSPRAKLMAVESQRDLASQAAVTAFAAGRLNQLSAPPRIIGAKVTAQGFFDTGATVGDEINFAVSDPYQTTTLAARLVGYRVTVGDESTPETVDLTLGDVL